METTLTNKIEEELILECKVLHSQIFNLDPSKEIISHYLNSHKIYFSKFNKSELEILRNLVAIEIDLEALEFYWRVKNAKNALTQKKMILFSLCEIYPTYKNKYNNFESNSFLKAFIILVYYTLRSIFKGLKGYRLYNNYVKPVILETVKKPEGK